MMTQRSRQLLIGSQALQSPGLSSEWSPRYQEPLPVTQSILYFRDIVGGKDFWPTARFGGQKRSMIFWLPANESPLRVNVRATANRAASAAL
jgi:hypothetical protein